MVNREVNCELQLFRESNHRKWKGNCDWKSIRNKIAHFEKEILEKNKYNDNNRNVHVILTNRAF